MLMLCAGALATTIWSTHALADGAAPCATPEQSAVVAQLYANGPAGLPFQAAMKLQVPESVVLSSLDSKRSVGVAGGEFAKIWESLTTWPEAMTFIVKGGQMFEIAGPVPGGKPSTRSRFFNLDHGGHGIGGHLRPDLVSAMYAIDLAGGEGPVRGVVFLDAQGESIFSVFVPTAESEDKSPSPANARFEQTRALMAALPQVCPAKH